MKISSLNLWQFAGLMVAILVGYAIIFNLLKSSMDKNKLADAPREITTPNPMNGTAIDTSNGMAARINYR